MPPDSADAPPQPAKAAPRRARDAEHGTVVLYRCRACDRVVPLWGSQHGMQRRGAKWPKRLKGRCRPGCKGILEPEEAAQCSNLDFRVLLRLAGEGNMGAARQLWRRWPPTRLDHLTWRDQPLAGDPGGAAA